MKQYICVCWWRKSTCLRTQLLGIQVADITETSLWSLLPHFLIQFPVHCTMHSILFWNYSIICCVTLRVLPDFIIYWLTAIFFLVNFLLLHLNIASLWKYEVILWKNPDALSSLRWSYAMHDTYQFALVLPPDGGPMVAGVPTEWIHLHEWCDGTVSCDNAKDEPNFCREFKFLTSFDISKLSPQLSVKWNYHQGQTFINKGNII